MRLPDDNKRRQIIATGAAMFASQSYHKVRLDDVAAAAGVGKGTLYVYFNSKEDLYFSIVYESLAALIARLREQLLADHSCVMHRLRTIIDELVNHAFQNPQFFELLKTVGLPANHPQWDANRDQMFTVVEETLRAGVESGELRDLDPRLTARFIPGMIRSAMTFGPADLTPIRLKQQIFDLIEHGIVCTESRPAHSTTMQI